MRLFSSAFAVYPEQPAVYDSKAKYAIAYHLESVIPRGGVVEVVSPKSVLCSVLPQIAKLKGARVFLKGASGESRAAFKDVLVDDPGFSDLTLAEPDAFVPGGALVNPSESSFLAKKSVVGVGSVLQQTSRNPSSHDFIELKKRVTENGIESLFLL